MPLDCLEFKNFWPRASTLVNICIYSILDIPTLFEDLQVIHEFLNISDIIHEYENYYYWSFYLIHKIYIPSTIFLLIDTRN